MHRRNKKILIVVGAIVVAFALGYGVALARSMAKRRAAYEALEQDGRPMVAAEFIPPEVPEDENAAPYYLYAADVLKQQAVTRKKTLLDHLAKLASSVIGGTSEPGEREELVTLLEQENVVAALAALEQALECPACRFDYGYDNGLWPEPFPVHDLRELARLWGARACLEAEAGRTAQAWDMVLAQFKFADALYREPLVHRQVARLGMVSDLCHIVRRLYEIAPPNEADRRKIETLLEAHIDVEHLVHAADAERLLRGEWLFNAPQDELYEAMSRDGMMFSYGRGPTVFSRLVFRVIAFRPRFVADHAAYLRMMRGGVQFLEDPYDLSESHIHQAMGNPADQPLLTGQWKPAIVFAKRIHCGVVARVRLTRAGLALLRYREAHGAFPDSLDALGLESLIDPFIEAPLHYRSEAEGFIVYSVGEDQQDNGGAPRRPLDTSGRRPKIPEYDLLWRYPREAGRQPGSGT